MGSEAAKIAHKNWLTEAVTLAAIPFLAYFIVYAFALGFAVYYDIPPEFVSVGFETLLAVSSVVACCTPSILGLAAAVLDPDSRNTARYGFDPTKLVIVSYISIFILVVILAVENLHYGHQFAVFKLVAYPGVFLLVFPLLQFAVNKLYLLGTKCRKLLQKRELVRLWHELDCKHGLKRVSDLPSLSCEIDRIKMQIAYEQSVEAAGKFFLANKSSKLEVSSTQSQKREDDVAGKLARYESTLAKLEETRRIMVGFSLKSVEYEGLYSTSKRALGENVVSLVIASISLALAAFTFGFYAAAKKTDYMTLNSTTPKVILAIYGDKAIVAPVDIRLRQVQRNFDVSSSSNSPLSFRAQHIGPLIPRYELGLVSLY